jgi:hypothetical protein
VSGSSGNFWARLGLTLVGYVAGFLIGGAFGAMIGGVVGGVVGSLVFPDPTQKIRTYGPRLQGLQVQNSSFGVPIPWLFGHMRMAGNIIWCGDRVEHTRTSTSGEGGKGGGGGGVEQIYTEYYYTQSFAVQLCRGPIAKLFRIWADNKLIYDTKPENDGPIIGQDLKFNFYYGTEDQLPDPIIESYQGIGNVPGNRGVCYCVFEDLEITPYGNRIPNLTFEIATASLDAFPDIEVPVGGLLGTGSTDTTGMLLGHNKEYCLLFYQEHWATVDLLANRVLATKTFAAGTQQWMAIDIDSYGAIYTTIKEAQYIGHIARLDQHLNIIMEGEQITDFWVGGLAVAKTESPYLYIHGNTPVGLYGQQYVVRMFDKIGLEELWSWEDIVSQDWGTGWAISHFCIDRDNCCWVLAVEYDQYQPTGLVRLGKLTPFKDTITWYTITAAGASARPHYIGYDPDTHRLVMAGDYSIDASQYAVWVWDIETHQIVKQFGPAAYDGHTYRAGRANLQSLVDGSVWMLQDDAHYIAIDLATLEITRSYAKASWPPSGLWHPPFIYDRICNALWLEPRRGDDGIFYKLLLDRASRETVLLGDIVQAICEEVGLSAADLNLTQIATDEIRGYLVDQQMAARQAIEPLQQAFYFDAAEIDGKISFVKRGGASIVTIPQEDLSVAEEGQERPDELPIARTQEPELPRVLNVSYIDIDQSYQAGTQRSIRQVTESVGELTITLPLVLTATEAKRIAETLHYIAWLERNRYAPISLPPKYSYLTVTDVITVERGGNTYLLHLQKADYGANNLIQVEAIPEDAAIYDSLAQGSAGEHVPEQAIDYPGATEFYLLDIPYLRDNEYYVSPYGFYAAACGRLAAWRGAQLYRSLDAGVSYQIIKALLNGAIIGAAANALPAPGDPWTWGNNTVTIRLLREADELASQSQANVLNGANAFLLGHPAKGWELCAFCDAQLNADGTYTLGTLLRALRGTEWMCDQHAAGDIFILLSTATIYRIDEQAADLDKERSYQAVSLGMPFSAGTLKAFTNIGRGLMPYAPAHIKGSRDGSNNLAITWMRRARVDGEWRDLVETPLDEASEAYEVDIVKAGAVVRTIDGLSAPTCSYTAAQQSADGFTPGDPIPLAVYQISAAIGRGFSGIATV